MDRPEPSTALKDMRLAHASPASRFAIVEGCDLHWIEDGYATDLPAVLLLSAQWLGASHFEDFAQALAGRTRVLRLDLPGHGLSGPFADGDHSAQAHARLVRAFAAHAGAGRHVVVGQSHSGIAAALLAADPPEGLAGLVLATSSGMPRDRSLSTGVGAAATQRAGSLQWYAERLRGLFRRPRDAAAFGAIVAAARGYGELPGRAEESARRLAQFEPELLARTLPQVAVPTLVTWSEHSTYLPVAMAGAIAALLPDCRGTAVIPDTGHLLLADAPQDAADRILAFLETLA
ncbi:MAG TPA: alpha/beta hydrolase [Novosphingobium sp.]|nr:alpha/beta hydrolase [Novosphingobium sp.]